MSAVRLERRAMGTSFEVFLPHGPRAAAEEALAEVDRIEDQCSVFLPTSEISRINAARGHVRVEPRLFALLRRMRGLFDATGGAFDGGISGARFGDGTVRAGALDLGGIGKGYAIDRAIRLLRARGVTKALVHSGTSTLFALGEWRVGLVDPRDPEHRFGSLTLHNQALSTSSNISGKPGHIPAGTQVCAWALCDNATDADAYSTAFLVGGLQRHEGVGAMVLGDALEHHGMRPEFMQERRTGLSRRTFMRGTAAVLSLGLVPRRAAAQEPQTPVSVAVVGVGEQGRLLLRQLVRMKGVSVPAVCDVREDARKKAVEIAGRKVETYEDFEHLLDEEELDAVVVATPTHLHAPVALAALKQEKHVFCEAPLARSIEDCKAIAKAAGAARGRIFMTGHQRRTSQLYPHVFKHVKSGAIGKVLQVRAQWNRNLSWRHPSKDKRRDWRLDSKTSGGLLLEQGSHVFDLVHWYLGALPEAVTGLGSILKWRDGRDVHDSVQAILHYPGGVQVNFGASLVNSFGDEQEIVVGSSAAVLIQRQHEALLFKEADSALVGWEAYARKQVRDGRRGIILDAMATKYKNREEAQRIGPDADKADYFAELERFVKSVRTGEAPPCDARAGLVAAVTALVAEQAVAKRAVLEFAKDHFEV